MIIRKLILLISFLLLLLIPFVGMQYSNEVKWSLNDFIIMGVILLSFGTFINKIIYHVSGFNRRVILILTSIILFFLLWAELAVGLFNSPFAGS